MTKVYSKCYDEIGAFNDTRYIVGMLEKVNRALFTFMYMILLVFWNTNKFCSF